MVPTPNQVALANKCFTVFFARAVTFAFNRAFDSSVGRAVDCRGWQLSIGHWFKSGSKEIFFSNQMRRLGPPILNTRRLCLVDQSEKCVKLLLFVLNFHLDNYRGMNYSKVVDKNCWKKNCRKVENVFYQNTYQEMKFPFNTNEGAQPQEEVVTRWHCYSMSSQPE